jgi:hypothetical protein
MALSRLASKKTKLDLWEFALLEGKNPTFSPMQDDVPGTSESAWHVPALLGNGERTDHANSKRATKLWGEKMAAKLSGVGRGNFF